MDMPLPPTDNMYKMFALGGIILIVASVYLFVGSRKWVVDEMHQVYARGAAFAEEGESVENGKAWIDAAKQLDESYAKTLISDVRTAQKFAAGIGGVGVLMSFFGFLAWYFRHQRYHDRILKHEADQLASK